MSAARGQFSSKVGFVMAAAGSAVGLGNIWGFPTQTASNGGAAFVVVYFILAFLLAYPALMAELIIGRHTQSNVVNALSGLSQNPLTRILGAGIGYYGVLVASLILSFYTIVAGWMLTYWAEPVTTVIGSTGISDWLTRDSLPRNLSSSAVFAGLTMWIIANGVENGIEKWSSRLMPLLIVILLLLILYVLTQPGAMEGLAVYLLPDLGRITDPALILSAMGQAFFSMSLGVGTMLIYGSYLSKEESLPRLGVIVTLVDSGIAFIAGLLIIPAIYVAKQQGATIFSEQGELLAGPDLIFQVLPALFDSMGGVGLLVSFAFFALMSIAALTSSISMLEVPVSMVVEKTNTPRARAAYIIGLAILAISAMIIFNFGTLFGFVIDLTTKYSEPLLGVMFCLFVGWIMHRDRLLMEVREGHENIENSLFWKIWPIYVRFVCPVLILATFIQSLA